MQNDSFPHTALPKNQKSIWLFFLLGLLMILLFWGINKWVLGRATADMDPEEIERSAFRTKTLADLRAEDQTKLETYAWVDRAKGSVQIPIKEAMELTLADLNKQPPRPAYPIPTPAPVPPAASPTATPLPSPAP